jgi:type VI secretion system protein ImpL
MKRILIGVLAFVVYLAFVVAGAFALKFSGTQFVMFCVVLGLLGAGVVWFTLWYLSKINAYAAQPGGSGSGNLDTLLRDANHKLRNNRVGIKSLGAAQIIYILGDVGAAKTKTVLESGLDTELLAGNLLRDGDVAPTELANIWLAGSSLIIEASGALLRQPALWQRLVKATRPGKLRSLFSKGRRHPARAVVLCVASDQLGAQANPAREAGQAMNERLRTLSQTLGIALPVYVLFTKTDRLPHFDDYVARLSAEEVKTPLGSLLAPVEAGSGLYAERATTLVSTRLDELTDTLADYRLDVLSRGGDPKTLASAYEFPRELGKRREAITDFLVEVGRPSQLGVNQFLRGFFFSGKREVMVDGAANSQPIQPPTSTNASDAGATSVFTLPTATAYRPAQASISSRRTLRTEPHWVFLPHLFSKLLLNDKSALEASRASTKVYVLKRSLLAGVCSCIFVYLALLTISFLNNRALEQRVRSAAAVPVNAATPAQFASVRDLQTLDQLGSVLLQLDSYRRNGAPLMNRWGLNPTEVIYPIACSAYASRFHALLLGPAQTNILTQLSAVQSPPLADADYNATYRPLKAYLITTSNPEKSTSDFLAPVFTTAWAGAVTPPGDLAHLAQTQFETYAIILSEPQSCMASTGGEPDTTTVAHAQDYLNRFGAFQHVYQSMLAAANHKSTAINFNSTFSGSARYIVDSSTVPGAFTKAGFGFMQDAIQHPEPYFSGEEWVLGSTAGGTMDATALRSQLHRQYVADYLSAWRNYMNAARFVSFQNWTDSAGKLSVLDSNSSPILELFSLISINTGVALPDIASAFQAPQAVIPAGSPADRFLASTNQPYITTLQGLEQAVKTFSQNPLSAGDPAAAAPILQAAGQADQAAENLRNTFNPDPDGKMDAMSFALLEAPIKSAQALARTAPAAGANGAGRSFCDQAAPVLSKFPFNPLAQAEASPEEAAQIFSSAQGALAQLYGKINQLVVLQGRQYGPASSSSIAINPGFLRFFNAAEQVSAALFPGGGNQPSLLFTLTEIKTPGTPDATLTIDGQQLTAGQSTTFHWIAQPDSRITLTSELKSATPIRDTWSVFRLALPVAHTANYFDYVFQEQGRTTQTVHFKVEGPGAALFDPHFMSNLHCVATIAKP